MDENQMKKILVIDDDEFMANALSNKLQGRGYVVIHASDGARGLELALERHPDLILLDIVLPKIDGLTILKKLRKDEWGSAVKVVMLSNLDRVDYQEKSFEQNASKYLVKTDWTLDQLTEKVLELLSA